METRKATGNPAKKATALVGTTENHEPIDAVAATNDSSDAGNANRNPSKLRKNRLDGSHEPGAPADATHDDNDDDDVIDLLSMANIVEDRWTPQPSWSIAPAGKNETKTELAPLFTSKECYLGLVDFFQHGSGHSIRNDPGINTEWLSVATESSSHPAGLLSLDAQPWVYSGGGLGNIDECLSLNNPPENRVGADPLVHVCLAGGTSRDSLTFASACVPAACSARDVFADDFAERVATAGFRAVNEIRMAKPDKTKNNTVVRDERDIGADYHELVHEYATLHKRIAAVGKYLGTGWVCGEYVVDWQPVPSLMWCGIMVVCAVCTVLGTKRAACGKGRATSNDRRRLSRELEPRAAFRQENHGEDCCDGDSTSTVSSPMSSSLAGSSVSSSSSSVPTNAREDCEDENKNTVLRWFWSAWDAREHLGRLTHQRSETACLDGLRVGSILWVIGAHVMAIQSSTGPGYLNPKDFLPPSGVTTTWFGQLLFGSRYAVDTFLCISGYLAALVLQRKLTANTGRRGGCLATALRVAGVLFFRIVRILPLYLCCMGFWMYVAPHLGSGPFWYQWEHFLEPCRQLWWTHLLFVNNFLPWGAPTEANCFYHSWYLAVDVQLFALFAPWLVLLYQTSQRKARAATVSLWVASVVGTAVLAYTQGWSVNSFDGIDVALFDVEGYAKPHVRAQSYLAGIFVAFWPRRRKRRLRKKGVEGHHRSPASSLWSGDNWPMLLAISGLAVLSFVTVTGAYARRACTFEESALEGDDCGSLWSPTVNFLYTAFSRALWSVCIALLLHLCLGEDNRKSNGDSRDEHDDDDDDTTSVTEIVRRILGWRLWTPLAHLSFGAYLIHPIVIYVWFLGEREKFTFRAVTYFMQFLSITVLTFVSSFVVTLLVEFPFGILLGPPSSSKKKEESPRPPPRDTEMASLLVLPSAAATTTTTNSRFYGSVPPELQERRPQS